MNDNLSLDQKSVNNNSSVRSRRTSPIRIREVDLSIERNIVIGSIVSDDFLRNSEYLIKPYYFKNVAARKVHEWCYNYYQKYGKAPGQTIKEIFEFRREELDDEDIEMIGSLLVQANDEFQRGHFNVEYILEEVREFCDNRELEIRLKTAMAHLEDGRREDAEKELTRYEPRGPVVAPLVPPDLESKQQVFLLPDSDDVHHFEQFFQPKNGCVMPTPECQTEGTLQGWSQALAGKDVVLVHGSGLGRFKL